MNCRGIRTTEDCQSTLSHFQKGLEEWTVHGGMAQTCLSRCPPEFSCNFKPVCDSVASHKDAGLKTQDQAVIVCMPGTCCSVDNKTLSNSNLYEQMS